MGVNLFTQHYKVKIGNRKYSSKLYLCFVTLPDKTFSVHLIHCAFYRVLFETEIFPCGTRREAHTKSPFCLDHL